MMSTLLDDRHLEAMVHGGALLGSGGGGSIETGLSVGRKALAAGQPRLVDLAELPDDATLVTLSGVGTVGVGGVDYLEDQYVRALDLFRQSTGHEIAGFMPSEVGAGAVTYGWRESAATGIPVVNAPCNGRAHPTGMMGSLELHRLAGYLTTAVAVGGNRQDGTYLELIVTADVSRAAQFVREAAARAGGSVAVVRNPVTVKYAREHAAVGALTQAQHIGQKLLASIPAGLQSVLQVLSDATGGNVLAIGTVDSVELADKAGFTVGAVAIRVESGKRVRVLVCNEYMMVLLGASRLAGFPDVIALIDEITCLPLNSGYVTPGQRVAVFGVSSHHLTLGSAMSDRTLLEPVETLLGIAIAGR